MLRISDIQRQPSGKIKVEYSLDTRLAAYDWHTVEIDPGLNLVEVDWVLRNEWAKRDEKR